MAIGPVETTGVSCGTVRDGSSANTRYLAISWTTVEDFPDQTSRYVVSVLQTGTEMVHEVRPWSSEFMNKQLEVEVELGTQYQITVRADNCGDRQEGNSVTRPVFQNGIIECFYIAIDLTLPYLSTVPLAPRIGMRRVDRKESGGAVLHVLGITIDFVVCA